MSLFAQACFTWLSCPLGWPLRSRRTCQRCAGSALLRSGRLAQPVLPASLSLYTQCNPHSLFFSVIFISLIHKFLQMQVNYVVYTEIVDLAAFTNQRWHVLCGRVHKLCPLAFSFILDCWHAGLKALAWGWGGHLRENRQPWLAPAHVGIHTSAPGPGLALFRLASAALGQAASAQPSGKRSCQL